MFVNRRITLASCLFLSGLCRVAIAGPLGTGLTYQGSLSDGGVHADGDYDFVFRLFGADVGGAQIGADVPVDDWPVIGGLFTVELDFGTSAFTGDQRWLEIAVRAGSSADPHTVLSPRQPLTAAPYALFALNGSAGALWQANGNDIYNANSANVGVGTPTPEAKLDVAGDVGGTGRIAFGNSRQFGPDGAGYDKVFDLSHTLSDFSSTDKWYILRSWLGIAPAGDLPAAVIRGHDFSTSVAQDLPFDINTVIGLRGGAGHFGTGHVNSLVGADLGAAVGPGDVTTQIAARVISRVTETGGSIDSNTGLRIQTGHQGPTGSIVNNYGLLVASPYTTGPITNHFGIYMEDQTGATNDSFALYSAGGKSYFAGDVGIGTTAPEAALHVNGDVRGDGRVALGNEGIFGIDNLNLFDRIFDFTHRVTDFETDAFFLNPFHSEILADPNADVTTGTVAHALRTRVVYPNPQNIDFLGGCDISTVHGGTGVVDSLRGAAVFTSATGDVNQQLGLYVSSDGLGSAAIGDNVALEIFSGHRGSGSGSVGNDYSLYINTPSTSSPLTNHYGIYLENQNFGANDRFAIYSAGGKSYFADEVGIGTTAPASLLHLSSEGGIELTVEADTDNVTETDNPRVVFKQDGGQVVGRVGYRSGQNGLEIMQEFANSLTLGTSNVDRVTIDSGGDVGIGTSSPTARLQVAGNGAGGLSLNVTDDLYVDPDIDFVGVNRSMPLTPSEYFGITAHVGDNEYGGMYVRTDGVKGLPFYGYSAGTDLMWTYYDGETNDWYLYNDGIRVTVTEAGDVGIGDTTPNARLDVTDSGATVAMFDRTTNDGAVIAIQQDSATQGTISVSGNTVSYNAFTGSHFGWTDQPIERGALVSLTGVNRRYHDDPKSEIVYGISPSTIANDPSCLGSYLSLLEPTQPAGAENPHLVMAVGNGEMWVVDTGKDIKPGDYLISSGVAGHAMKDDERRFPIGHVVARAAEAVEWGDVTDTVDGRKHKCISVMFESFVRGDAAAQAANDALRAENESLRKRLERIEALLARK